MNSVSASSAMPFRRLQQGGDEAAASKGGWAGPPNVGVPRHPPGLQSHTPEAVRAGMPFSDRRPAPLQPAPARLRHHDFDLGGVRLVVVVQEDVDVACRPGSGGQR